MNARPDFVELVCHLTQPRPGGNRAGLGSKPTQKGGVVVISKGAFFRRSGHSGRPLLTHQHGANQPCSVRPESQHASGSIISAGHEEPPLKRAIETLQAEPSEAVQLGIERATFFVSHFGLTATPYHTLPWPKIR